MQTKSQLLGYLELYFECVERNQKLILEYEEQKFRDYKENPRGRAIEILNAIEQNNEAMRQILETAFYYENLYHHIAFVEHCRNTLDDDIPTPLNQLFD